MPILIGTKMSNKKNLFYFLIILMKKLKLLIFLLF